jgi:hypothetical protein
MSGIEYIFEYVKTMSLSFIAISLWKIAWWSKT